MIELDNPPVVLAIIVLAVFVLPQIYSFFVDKFDKTKPQIKR